MHGEYDLLKNNHRSQSENRPDGGRMRGSHRHKTHGAHSLQILHRDNYETAGAG